MIRRKSRLHRVLDPTGSAFALSISDGETFTDDEIRSVVIRRGTASTLAGMQPSTLEVTVHGRATKRVTGRSASFTLSPGMASALASRLGGHHAAADILDRFHGRLGTFDYNDHPRTGQRRTTLTASSWQTQENLSGKRLNVYRGMNILEALASVLYHYGTRYHFNGRGTYDKAGEALSGASFGDVWGKYADALYIPAPVHRNGNMYAVTLPKLREEAIDRLAEIPHLTRGQVIAPARWTQPNEANSEEYHFKLTNPAGDVITVPLAFEYSGTLTPDYDTTEVDWSQLWRYGEESDHWLRAAQAYIFRDASQRWFLTGVRVDLLHLISSANPYDRRVAAYLLTLEVGQSVNLSGDWQQDVNGVYFASEITETITGSEWTLDISLLPYLWVIGETSPVVPALVWDSAIGAWDDQTVTWDSPIGVTP